MKVNDIVKPNIFAVGYRFLTHNTLYVVVAKQATNLSVLQELGNPEAETVHSFDYRLDVVGRVEHVPFPEEEEPCYAAFPEENNSQAWSTLPWRALDGSIEVQMPDGQIVLIAGKEWE